MTEGRLTLNLEELYGDVGQITSSNNCLYELENHVTNINCMMCKSFSCTQLKFVDAWQENLLPFHSPHPIPRDFSYTDNG